MGIKQLMGGGDRGLIHFIVKATVAKSMIADFLRSDFLPPATRHQMTQDQSQHPICMVTAPLSRGHLS